MSTMIETLEIRSLMSATVGLVAEVNVTPPTAGLLLPAVRTQAGATVNAPPTTGLLLPAVQPAPGAGVSHTPGLLLPAV